MKKTLIITLVFIITFSLLNVVNPATAAGLLYASPGGLNEGSCPISAPCTIQRALTRAASGDTIYLQSGTYIRVNEADQRVLWITKSVTLIGRCDFSSGVALCSPGNPKTILDGETERRVIYVQASGADVSINGVEIRNGNAFELEGGCPSSGTYVTKGCGGGIHASALSSLTLNEVSFIGNYGAFESLGTTMAGFGGGLYANLTHTINIHDCNFGLNTATSEGYATGGAIYISTADDEVNIKDSVFDQNVCSSNIPSSVGCAIQISNSNVINIERNDFNMNNPIYTLAIEGSALEISTHQDLNLIGNNFSNHFGGSVVRIYKGPVGEIVDTIHENTFWNNSVIDMIDISGTSYYTNITNNFFGYGEAGRMDERGGPLRSGVALDAGILANAYFYHNTFAKLDYGINVKDFITGTIKNNIFAYIRSEAVNIYGGGSSFTADTNLFYTAPLGEITDANKVTTNPYLVNVSTGDFHIQSNSGAKDHGLNLGYSRDVDGQLRPIGIPDIGADEYMICNFLPMIFR